MKQVNTREAVGHILCHDITQIIKGVTKDARFRKGHVVSEEDIPVLLSLGKEHLYIWENRPGYLHENEAALILFEACRSPYLKPSEIKEGKIECIATADGLLVINEELLHAVNALDEMMIATRQGFFPVHAGDKVAAGRVIPLTIREEKMKQVQELTRDQSIIEILPFQKKRVGIVTTGSEVAKGLIKDTFGDVIRAKVAEYPSEVIGQTIVGDDPQLIAKAITDFRAQGADLIICTGGMSVDPDDTTPTAIAMSGAVVERYGAPVLPGAMFLLAWHSDGTPVLGLPGCVMYSKRTIFDLVLPRVMADLRISSDDLSRLGYGGLCLSCDDCTFPQCGFGK